MGSRPGDWNCASCQHLNFQRRDSCQRCGCRRTAATTVAALAMGDPSFGFFQRGGGGNVRPGDWYCNANNCSTHNFATRSTCFNCSAPRDHMAAPPSSSPFSATTASRSAWKSGDWICTRMGCNEHNFANRTECFRCSAPREYNEGQ